MIIFLTLALSPGNGHWGDWYPTTSQWESCPVSSFVSEVRFRMAPEATPGTGDDTALNSIELKCKDVYGCEAG